MATNTCAGSWAGARTLAKKEKQRLGKEGVAKREKRMEDAAAVNAALLKYKQLGGVCARTHFP